MQKPLRAANIFLLKWAYFSGFYVQLFHFNGNENNLFIVI